MKTYFWFRRDLNLEDNVGLHNALNSGNQVQAIFIFDENIINELPKNDARITFIHQELTKINDQLNEWGSSLQIIIGQPIKVFEKLSAEQAISVFTNRDYEPYAIARDNSVEALINSKGGQFQSFKNQVIFEQNEVVKNDGSPYKVYTPYSKKWRQLFHQEMLEPSPIAPLKSNFEKSNFKFISLNELGFEKSEIQVKAMHPVDGNYKEERDIPSKASTSNLSVHLRFGTVSIRQIIKQFEGNFTFVSELIWREFFMQILWHYPSSSKDNFKRKYDGIEWRNNEQEFEAWKQGKTGYPIVDAGMRELNETGYIHNRVRMIVASFLCKHLLIDWRWGEAYFAEKLLDFELSANVGNWQWVAGTGCDAAPYFRIFNPYEQLKKFDPKFAYVQKWVPDWQELTYPKEIVDHKFARQRCLETYKKGIEAFSV